MLFRNILSLIAVLTAAGVPAGCSTTARLTRRQATAHLAQLSRTERQSKVRDDRPQVVRVERDSSDYYLVPVERDGQGEALGTVPIEEVVVVARVRSIPERRGRVTLDFNVELPKELLGRSRSVVITPFLHRQDEQIPLDDIIIRGALFDRVQQRDYWQYTTYLGRFRPDSVRAERAFQRFVKYPYAQDARLDSLIENRTSISYYYSQEVPTEETSRKMLITLRGRVEGLDDSAYTLPPSDTLTYTVSSLLSFLDTLPRYRIRVIDKYVTVNDRYSLSFLTGDARLVDTLGDNARELARIAALMERIVTQREFHVDSIVLTASASPEGRRGLNERLSRARAEALRSYQAEDGLFHTVIDDAASYEEASGTAAMAAGLLRGMKAGILDESYRVCADRAITALCDCVDTDGTVLKVSAGTAMGMNAEHYKGIGIRPMAYGQALTLIALCEALQ